MGDWTCAEGHTGALCDVCQQNYGKSFSGECLRCRTLAVNVAAASLICLGVVAILVFFMVSSAQNFAHPTSVIACSQISILQLLVFLQTASLMSEIQFGMTGLVKRAVDLLFIGATVNFLRIQPVDCLVRSTLGLTAAHAPVVFPATLFVLIIISVVISRVLLLNFPFLLGCKEARQEIHNVFALTEAEADLLGLKYWDAPGVRHVKNHQKRRLLVFSVCTATIVFYLPMLIACFQDFRCMDIVHGGDSDKDVVSYIVTEKAVLCNDPSHQRLLGFVYFMTAFLCALPVALLLLLGAMNRVLGIEDFAAYSTVLILGLSRNRFYTPSILMFRQLLLVVFVEQTSFPFSGYAYIWAIVLTAVVMYATNPYIMNRMNKLDVVGQSVIIFIGNVSLLFSRLEPGTHATLSTISLVALCIGSAVFLWQALKEPLQLYKSSRRVVYEDTHIGITTSISDHLAHLINAPSSPSQNGLPPRPAESSDAKIVVPGQKALGSSPNNKEGGLSAQQFSRMRSFSALTLSSEQSHEQDRSRTLRSLFDGYGEEPDVDPLTLLVSQHDFINGIRRRNQHWRKGSRSSSSSSGRSSTTSSATRSDSISSGDDSSSDAMDEALGAMDPDSRREELRRELELELDLDEFIARTGLSGGQRFTAGVPPLLGSSPRGSPLTSKRARRDRSQSVARSRPSLVRKAVRKKLLAVGGEDRQEQLLVGETDQEAFASPSRNITSSKAGPHQTFEQFIAEAERRQPMGSESETGGEDNNGICTSMIAVPPLGAPRYLPSEQAKAEAGPCNGVLATATAGEHIADAHASSREARAVRIAEQLQASEAKRNLAMSVHNETAMRVVRTARGLPPPADGGGGGEEHRAPSSLIVKKARKGIRSQRQAADAAAAGGSEGGNNNSNAVLTPFSLL
jgi:hypothetical protein